MCGDDSPCVCSAHLHRVVNVPGIRVLNEESSEPDHGHHPLLDLHTHTHTHTHAHRHTQ